VVAECQCWARLHVPRHHCPLRRWASLGCGAHSVSRFDPKRVGERARVAVHGCNNDDSLIVNAECGFANSPDFI